MQEIFGIASFRSRQQVMRFDAALRRAGYDGFVTAEISPYPKAPEVLLKNTSPSQ